MGALTTRTNAASSTGAPTARAKRGASARAAEMPEAFYGSRRALDADEAETRRARKWKIGVGVRLACPQRPRALGR